LGTGVGGGIIIHGKLYSGVNSAAGEWCGASYLDGTFEDYCSGKFFNRVYQSKPRALAKLALEGDPIALKAFDEFGTHVGELLKVILYSLAPEAIVLGGSIRKTFPLFEKSMRATLQTFAYPSVLTKLQLLVSDLDETAIHGAVALIDFKKELIPGE
jgi:glucokinase